MSDDLSSLLPVSACNQVELLAACPVPALDATNAAAVFGVDREATLAAVRTAEGAGLLRACSPLAEDLERRWEITPAAREYRPPPGLREQVVAKLTGVMLARMLRANATLPVVVGRRLPEYGPYTAEPGRPTGYSSAGAVAWLLAEVPAVLALQRAAAHRGDDASVCRLAERITGAVPDSPPDAYEQLEEILREGAVAARSLGLPEESTLRCFLSILHTKNWRHERGLASAAVARRVAYLHGDERATADAVGAEGRSYLAQRKLPMAQAAFREALDLAAADPVGEPRWWEARGDCARAENHLVEALGHYNEAARRVRGLQEWPWYAGIAAKIVYCLADTGLRVDAAEYLKRTLTTLERVCPGEGGDRLREFLITDRGASQPAIGLGITHSQGLGADSAVQASSTTFGGWQR